MQQEGLAPGSIRALFGPASGPKWLVLAGLDRALLASGLLQPPTAADERTLLAGSSAGAWRMLALAAREPLEAHQFLAARYIEQVFSRRDTPRTVSLAYREMLAELLALGGDRLLAHPSFDLAIHTARLRLGASRTALVAAFLAAGGLNLATRRATGWLFERVLFHTRPANFAPPVAGRLVALDHTNLLAAARATGTVPFYLETILDIPGAPTGGYVDGGLTDYHLNQVYLEADRGIVLLPHYRRLVLPRWLDRMRPSRQPPPAATADLLQLYPSPQFLARLPDGQLPDRQDFQRFMRDPARRIRRWREAVALSEELGAQFLADLESGRIVDRVEPL